MSDSVKPVSLVGPPSAAEVSPSTGHPVESGPTIHDGAVAAGPGVVAPAGALRGLGWRFAAVCVAHTAVDFLSAVIVPILSVLEGRVHLTMSQGAFLLAAGSVCSGAVQPLVAWLSDRYNTRLFGPLGLVLAGVCAASIAWVEDFGQLLMLQVVLTAGIGAFHPVGASAMGQLAARRRSLGVAIFFTFGMIGSFSGSKLVPAINESYGLGSFGWFMLPAVVVGGLLWIAIGSMSHRADNAHRRAAAFIPEDRSRRWWMVGVLYCSNIIRFTVNMALAMLFVRFAEQQTLLNAGTVELTQELRSLSAIMNGNLQAAMTVGMAMGGLSAGVIVKSGHEKPILVGSALIGVPAIAMTPFAPVSFTILLAAIAGMGFAASVPVSISVAQRLLPHRTSLASGLMMGGAWSFAAFGPIVSQWLYSTVGLAWSFVIVSGSLATAGAVSMLISSSLLRDTALAEAA